MGTALIVLLALWCLYFFFYWAVSNAFELFRDLGEGIDNLLCKIDEGPERRRRRREIKAEGRWYMDWVEAKLGNPQVGDSLHETILAARQQAPLLRRLIEKEIPQTIACCVKLHRLAGRAAGVESIAEIALEPECYRMRMKVIGVLGATMLKLSAYPLFTEDPQMMQNQILLRMIQGNCRICPYLEHSPYTAPLLCSSAISAGVKEEDVKPDETESR